MPPWFHLLNIRTFGRRFDGVKNEKSLQASEEGTCRYETDFVERYG